MSTILVPRPSQEYQLIEGVHFGGTEWGETCGTFISRVELQRKCTASPHCVGYSTRKYHSSTSIGENGFHPWCMKKTEASRAVPDHTHNYYRKIRRFG